MDHRQCDSKTITEGINVYHSRVFHFAIYGFTFFFMTGMRRSYDIGLPFCDLSFHLLLLLV